MADGGVHDVRKYIPFVIGGVVGAFVVASYAMCGATFAIAFAMGILFGNISVLLAVRSL